MNRRSFIKTVAGVVTSAVGVGLGIFKEDHVEYWPRKHHTPLPGLMNNGHLIYHPSQEELVRKIMGPQK